MGWDQGSVLALSPADGDPLPSGPQGNHASRARKELDRAAATGLVLAH